MKTKIVGSHTADSKPVKQEVNSAVILPPLVFPEVSNVCMYFEWKARFKNVNNYLNTNIYSYLETSGSQSSNLYLNVVNLFNTSVN
jgi:hypothetical protein